MEAELAGLLGRDQEQHVRLYQALRQRARDGDSAARAVQFVFGLRVSLEDGCASPGDRLNFAQQLELLQMHLQTAPPAERVFAAPTVLLALHAVGRAQEQPAVAAEAVRLARQVFSASPIRLGELLLDMTHGLRLGCHLKVSLPLLEEAVSLLSQGPRRERADGAQLGRRDLAALHFLLGDALTAQRELRRLRAEVVAAGPAVEPGATPMEARLEVVDVLLSHLLDENAAAATPGGERPAAPRETGPGWQALRTVQQEASCPESTPADLRLVRVPVPRPACAPESASAPTPTGKSP